jgi:hypothetical protein
MLIITNMALLCNFDWKEIACNNWKKVDLVSKHKLKLLLHLGTVPWRRMKSGSIALHIIKLRYRWITCFTFWLFYICAGTSPGGGADNWVGLSTSVNIMEKCPYTCQEFSPTHNPSLYWVPTTSQRSRKYFLELLLNLNYYLRFTRLSDVNIPEKTKWWSISSWPHPFSSI